MTNPEPPAQSLLSKALPAMKKRAKNQIALQFAIDEYERALGLHYEILNTLLPAYMRPLPDMPRAEFEFKFSADVILAQEVLSNLNQRGLTLITLVRELASDLPSWDRA